MPIYEYRCSACGKRFSMLTLRVSEKVEPQCTHCGSVRAQRLMSRFAMPKSDEARLAAASDPSKLRDLDESDPKSIGRWMKRMGEEVGEELTGGDLGEMAEGFDSGDGDADLD